MRPFQQLTPSSPCMLLGIPWHASYFLSNWECCMWVTLSSTIHCYQILIHSWVSDSSLHALGYPLAHKIFYHPLCVPLIVCSSIARNTFSFWYRRHHVFPGIWCYDFDRFRLYSRDQSQSVSDNAQAYVQGASWAHEYQLEDAQYPQVWEWISQSSSIIINKVTWLKTS